MKLIDYATWLPFSFDIAMAILPFFVVGKYYHLINIEINVFEKFVVNASIWAGLLFASYFIAGKYMELACRRYTLFPLGFIIAIAGTIMISSLSVAGCRIKHISFPIRFLGRNSLYMLCVHMLDTPFF